MVKISGKQYLVSPGDTIVVEGLLGKVGEILNFSEVLLTGIADQVIIGTPLVPQASIKAEVVAAGKGEKIRVVKFKAKSRYRRATGFRPLITTLKVTSVGDTGEKKEAKPVVKPATRKKAAK